MKVKSESEVAQSCPTLGTPWTAAYQAPLSVGFSRQEYWSGVPLPSLLFILVLNIFPLLFVNVIDDIYCQTLCRIYFPASTDLP